MEQALYRKYRPNTLAQVRGQQHILSVLENVIKSGDIAHAYLFSGSRGTGKTSTARIFARDIGCKDEDMYEIDAASNRGIDDVRALREAVNVLPFSSPYKVYIIDEAHMLTKEAFNALLKTLEEPPKHVIFILATTETHKVPETIISRCQLFAFQKPSKDTLKKLIQDVAKKEGYRVPSPTAELVAMLGDGSFRDTLGVLQKLLQSHTGKEKQIDENDAAKILGLPHSSLVNNFLMALVNKDAARALSTVRDVSEQDMDMSLFVKLSLQKLRGVLLLKFAPELEKDIALDFTTEDFDFLKTFPIPRDPKLSSVLSELLAIVSEVSRSFIPALPIEIVVLRLCGEDGNDRAYINKK